MSERNIEIVREGYEHFNRTGSPPFHILDERVVLRESEAAIVGGEVFEGHEGVRAALGQLSDAFDDLRFDVERVFDSGDTVVCFVKLTGKGSASEVPVEIQFAHLLKLRDGRITEWQVHQSREEALEAAGLAE